MNPDHDAYQHLLQRSMHRVHIEPACRSAGCNQGRKQCPSPDTCQSEPTGLAGYIAIATAAAVCAVVTVAHQVGMT